MLSKNFLHNFIYSSLFNWFFSNLFSSLKNIVSLLIILKFIKFVKYRIISDKFIKKYVPNFQNVFEQELIKVSEGIMEEIKKGN